MATTITSTQVVADFGAYYINTGKNENDIFTRLMEPFETMGSFRIIESDDTILRESNAAFSEVLQSFQTTFTPKGGVTFTPKAIPLFNVKIDELVYPDSVKNSWLQFMTTNKTDRTTWPFVRWFIEVYLMRQIKKDLEMSGIYSGVYVAPTSGTAGNAADSMNGIKKTINDAITAATIVPITTGTPSTDPATWCTQVETFAAGIPEVYWGEKMNLNMSKALRLRYQKGRRAKYNQYYGQVDNVNAVEDFDNITVNGVSSHRGANKIWATPEINAVMGMMGGANQNTVEVEKIDRQVKIYTDFWIGIGYIDNGIVFTNDQDLS